MPILKKIANILSRKRSVAGTIHSFLSLEHALRLRQGEVDFLELRADAFASDLDQLEPALDRLKAPLIITVRAISEGGAEKLGPARRREIFERFLPWAALIDVELRSIDQMAPVLAAAKKRKIGRIISFHNFTTTPPEARLQELARRAIHAHADIFKIATQTNSPVDVAVLLSFMAHQKRIDLSVMGMGRFGRASRLLFAQAGSVLNYGYLGNAQVKGQLPALLLKERLAELDT